MLNLPLRPNPVRSQPASPLPKGARPVLPVEIYELVLMFLCGSLAMAALQLIGLAIFK